MKQATAALHWDDLRFLRAALRAGSLAGAARALKVEHTTIGRRLSSLERALGAPVVVRGPGGLRPTAVGAELVPLLDDIERIVEAVRAVAVARRSHVRVAAPSGYAPLFHEKMGELRAQHPEISLEIISGARRVDLQKSEADLAVRIGPIDDESLIVKKLGEVGWALYASDAYVARKGAVDVDDLSGHDVIGYDQAMSRSPPALWLEERAKTSVVVLRTRDMVDMRDAAKNGVGVAVLPCGLGDGEPTLMRLTKEDVATRAISIVYRRDARLSAPFRAVVKFVADVVTTRGIR